MYNLFNDTKSLYDIPAWTSPKQPAPNFLFNLTDSLATSSSLNWTCGGSLGQGTVS